MASQFHMISRFQPLIQRNVSPLSMCYECPIYSGWAPVPPICTSHCHPLDCMIHMIFTGPDALQLCSEQRSSGWCAVGNGAPLLANSLTRCDQDGLNSVPLQNREMERISNIGTFLWSYVRSRHLLCTLIHALAPWLGMCPGHRKGGDCRPCPWDGVRMWIWLQCGVDAPGPSRPRDLGLLAAQLLGTVWPLISTVLLTPLTILVCL